MLKHLVVDQPHRKSLNVMLTAAELEIIKKKAQEFAGGNMSAWIRYASINYRPPKSALVERK